MSSSPAEGPGTGAASSARSLFLRVLLGSLLALSALRLAGFAVRFGEESVQADFAAFYTAGEAIRHGVSPYRTHADRDEPIWDGVDTYRHSRFLYPPLVAMLFRPLAALPYAAAKRLWMVASLVFLALALATALRAADVRPGRETLLALGVFVCLFHPLLTLLERGQIDTLTLALILWALRPMVAHGHDGLGSGLLLAAATLLKLNVAYLVPFLVFRKRWRALTGYAFGGVLILAASLAVNGPRALGEYVSRELPRISTYGEGGTSEMLLEPDVLRALRSGAPEGATVKDGRVYRPESFGFVANASLARVISARTGGHRRTTAVSIGILAALGLAVLLRERRHRLTGSPWDPLRELTYWQAALVVILLSGPLTWAMNTVWLLPAAVVILGFYHRLRDGRQAAALASCALGLLITALPDHNTFALLTPYAVRLATWRYVIAEAVVLASLLALLGRAPEREQEPIASNGRVKEVGS